MTIQRQWDANIAKWVPFGLGYFARTDSAPVNVAEEGADPAAADNTAVINAAVAKAKTSGRRLMWPTGTYPVTGNLVDLHTVRHLGPGAIQRGTDVFHPAATTGQPNVLYVATTGAATNDGLTAALPMSTLQVALDALPNYGPILGGVWTIKLAAGTYSTQCVVPSALLAEDMVTIQGPAAGHPNVPTAVFSRGYNSAAVGINCPELGFDLTVKDILFSGYNGSTASCGVQVFYTSKVLYSVNAHFTDCHWGLSGTRANVDVKGGIFTRCGFLGDTPNTATPSTRNGSGAGVRSLMQTRHAIGTQNAGNLTAGPVFTGCLQGMFAQELSTGHSDWVTYKDCITGVYAAVGARVNLDGTSFARNTRDIRTGSNAVVYVTAATTFATGVDESAAKIVLTGGADMVDDFRLFTTHGVGYGSTMRVLDTQHPGTVVTATTGVAVWTATLGPYLWRDAPSGLYPQKRIKLKIVGTLTGTLNSKRVNLRLGATLTQLVFSATETGVFVAEGEVWFTDTAAQTLLLSGYRHLGSTTRISRATGTNALTAATNLTVEAQNDSAGDSVTIHTVDVSWGG